MSTSNLYEGVYKPAFDQSREKLLALTSGDIIKRSLCNFDPLESSFSLESFGLKIKITYPNGLIRFAEKDEKIPLDWALILLNYLAGSKKLSLASELVSYRDLPLGNVFYPNIRQNVIQVLGDSFSKWERNRVLEVFSQLGFKTIGSRADLAVEGYFAPRIPVILNFWEGDDEVPSSCQILFDRTISEHMHIEDIAVLCSIIKNLIIDNYQKL